MSQILARRSFRDRPKHTVLLLAGLFSALLGLFFLLFDETSNDGIIRFISYICIGILVLAWRHFDSLERRQRFYPWLRWVIVTFGLFALFIYLFKSRGFKQGMRVSGLALLSLSGLLVIMLLSAFMWESEHWNFGVLTPGSGWLLRHDQRPFIISDDGI